MRCVEYTLHGIFLFMGALESRHETEFEGARSESRARRPPQTPSSGSALENRGGLRQTGTAFSNVRFTCYRDP